MSKKNNKDVEWFVANEDEVEVCAACGSTVDLTLHHLIPQVKCHNKYKDTKDDPANHMTLCRSCHDQIHSLWDESTLRDLYNTKDKLLAAPEMQKFIKWKIKHQDFTGHSKMSNDRKRKRY